MDNNETNCLRSRLGIQHKKCNCPECQLLRKDSDCKPKESKT